MMGGGTYSNAMKSALKFNPNTNTWIDIADMNVARLNAGKLFLITVKS